MPVSIEGLQLYAELYIGIHIRTYNRYKCTDLRCRVFICTGRRRRPPKCAATHDVKNTHVYFDVHIFVVPSSIPALTPENSMEDVLTS